MVAGALTLCRAGPGSTRWPSLVIAAVVVVGAWDLLRQSLHLLFDGVPAHVDLRAVHDCLRAMPGVAEGHDLHVWAMGTAEVALTAHLVMPAGPADDTFLRAATEQLRERFRIGHVTLQSVRTPVMAACAGPKAPPSAAREPILSDSH